jgi:hypothetical protein
MPGSTGGGSLSSSLSPCCALTSTTVCLALRAPTMPMSLGVGVWLDPEVGVFSITALAWGECVGDWPGVAAGVGPRELSSSSVSTAVYPLGVKARVASRLDTLLSSPLSPPNPPQYDVTPPGGALATGMYSSSLLARSRSLSLDP